MAESATEVASIEETLRKEGYSKKAIEEVLKWYGYSERQKRHRQNRDSVRLSSSNY